MLPAAFEPATHNKQGPQTYALDRTATGFGTGVISYVRATDNWIFEMPCSVV